MKKIYRGIFTLLFALILLCTTAMATSEPGPVSTIKKGETSPRDVFAAGQSVLNEETVKGDFIAAGSEVSSKGTVEGDYICAGSNIFMTGDVLGNMRSVGQTINISGKIGKNLNSFSQATTIEENAVTQLKGEMPLCKSKSSLCN